MDSILSFSEGASCPLFCCTNSNFELYILNQEPLVLHTVQMNTINIVDIQTLFF